MNLSAGASTKNRGETAMFHTIRNTLMAATAKSTGAVLIAALISTGTAAADDISKVTGNIVGKVPLRVVILSADGRFRDIGRTSEFKTGNFSIDLKEKVSKYHWEVFAKGELSPCDKKRDVATSSITAKCEEKAAARGVQQGSDTISLMINNQSDVAVTVKFKDAENSDFSTFVKEK